MSFHNWLQHLQSIQAMGWGNRMHRRRGSLRAPTHRPNLDVLEDRCLLSFSIGAVYPVGENPQAVVSGLFNDDSVLDLAVANSSDSSVSVLLGNGDGTFQSALTPAPSTGANPHSLAVGDFDNDGKLDLATANGSSVS